MSLTLLKRLTQNSPAEDFALKPARVHEAEGTGQITFAIFQMLTGNSVDESSIPTYAVLV